MKKLLLGLIMLYSLILATFYFFQNQIIFHEKSLKVDYKYKFSIKFKEIWLKTEPKDSINAIHFFTDSIHRKGIVVYFHGNADNLARWGNYAQDFTKNGYDVLMCDYRGFGKSKGSFSERGFLIDANTTYSFAKTIFAENQIIIYGRSLGSGIATQIAAKNNPNKLLLETPYVNFPDIALHFFPIVPFDILSKYLFSTHEYIKKVKCPIHIFHGTDDGLVYYESSLKLCKTLGVNPNQILTTIVGGKHKNLSKFPRYHQALDSCLALN